MASFFLNRDYIARVLCINKDKPESECNGACQLKKQIEKDQKKQEKSGIDIKIKEILVCFPTLPPNKPPVITYEWIEKTYKNTYCIFLLHEGFVHSIFHPPAFTI